MKKLTAILFIITHNFFTSELETKKLHCLLQGKISELPTLFKEKDDLTKELYNPSNRHCYRPLNILLTESCTFKFEKIKWFLNQRTPITPGVLYDGMGLIRNKNITDLKKWLEEGYNPQIWLIQLILAL